MPKGPNGEGQIAPDELVEDFSAGPIPPPSPSGALAQRGAASGAGSAGSAGSLSARASPSGGGGSAGSASPGSALPGSASDDARRSLKNDPLVGQTLDNRFVIRRLIARGGMGKIYEAEQTPLGRAVALKVMDLGYAQDLDPDFRKRFFLEASTCAKLSHPNTIRVFDYGSAEPDRYYIAMEYVEGKTLLKLLEEEAPLDPLRTIHIARQICGSLGEAHGQGVIHRDLKPSNVLLTHHGEHADFVKVLDFGLVKLMREDAEEMTRSGLFLGSPNYMSPEQIRASRIDQRSDLYSLGVILYMCLTGHSPFKRDTSIKVLLAQLEDDPPPFEPSAGARPLTAALEWLVRTCLAKDPEHRFGSVQELNRALKACEAELRGELSQPLTLQVEGGHLVAAPEVDAAIASLPWSGAAMGPVGGSSQRVAPVTEFGSGGSLAGQRLAAGAVTGHGTTGHGTGPVGSSNTLAPRPAAASGTRRTAVDADAIATDPSMPRPDVPGSTVRRTPKRPRPPGGFGDLAASPLFVSFLAVVALALLAALLTVVLRGPRGDGATAGSGEGTAGPSAGAGEQGVAADSSAGASLPADAALEPAPGGEPGSVPGMESSSDLGGGTTSRPPATVAGPAAGRATGKAPAMAAPGTSSGTPASSGTGKDPATPADGAGSKQGSSGSGSGNEGGSSSGGGSDLRDPWGNR